MKSPLALLRHFFRSAFQGVRQAPFVHFVAVLTIAIALFLAAVERSGLFLLDRVVQALSTQLQVTVYLRPEATTAEADALAARLAQLPAAAGSAVRVVSKEEALSRLQEALGPAAKALDGAGVNPLPFSVELKLPNAEGAWGKVRALAGEVQRWPKVEAVDCAEPVVSRLDALAAAGRLIALLASFIGAAATVVIVSATLQLAIYSRRQEIEIQKLVGATNGFVRVPFVLEGLLQGVLAAAVAGGALWVLGTQLSGRLVSLLAFFAGAAVSSPWPRTLPLELFGAGAVLGLLGSFVAVGRFLKA